MVCVWFVCLQLAMRKVEEEDGGCYVLIYFLAQQFGEPKGAGASVISANC